MLSTVVFFVFCLKFDIDLGVSGTRKGRVPTAAAEGVFGCKKYGFYTKGSGESLKLLPESHVRRLQKKEYPTAIRGELLLHSHHISTH